MDDLAKHTAAITDAMFNGKRVIQYTPERLSIDETIEMAKKLEHSIIKFTRIYPDNRGSLSEAMESISVIIDNLEGHKKDVDEGRE